MRYFFHDGSSNAQALDLANDESACALACETLGQLIKEALITSPGKTISLRVTEDGRSVLSLTFSQPARTKPEGLRLLVGLYLRLLLLHGAVAA
jgi:hypothetical protein